MKRRLVYLGIALVVVVAGVEVASAVRGEPSPCRAGKDDRPVGAPPQPDPAGRNPGIWSIGTDGTSAIRVHLGVEPALQAEAFDLSPDGSRFVYPTNDGRITVANADGTTSTVLQGGLSNPLGAYGNYPRWSPDGRHIALTAEGVQVVNADGSSRRKVTTYGSGDPPNYSQETAKQPAWSPDGGRIVFSNDAYPVASNERLEVINADGSGRRILTADRRFRYQHADWSPDGQRITFSALGGYYGSWIGVVGADGRGLRRIARHCSGVHPTWSPDGKKIAFNDNYGILVMNPDGSHLERVPNTWYATSPNWSPDGTKIFFLRY
jgi:Tol biopolymer transport system component